MDNRKKELSRREKEMVEELVAWLWEKAASFQYGEIGVSLTFHAGTITHSRKNEDVSSKLDNKD